MPTQKAIFVADQCWCDPRVSDRVMDSEMATVFAEIIDEYIEALQWCGGSADFGEGGRARVGWNKITPPLLSLTKTKRSVMWKTTGEIAQV